MKREHLTTESMLATEPANYGDLPLLELTRRIGYESNRIALEELYQNRPLFSYKRDRSLLLGAFLRRLKESNLARRWTGANVMILERAYDLALDKFSNLPEKNQGRHRPGKTRGPDCRYYYRAFYKYTMARLSEMDRSDNAIRVEMTAAENLGRMVLRHFYLSCLESKRQAEHSVRRYCWQRNGRAVSVWMPSMLSGRQCRLWLEANIQDYDPSRVGERQRVQDTVNRLLTWPRTISLCDVDGGAEHIPAPTDWVSSIVEQEISTHGLARTVAQEKAANIEQQRPAIRQLGADKLEELIHTVFARLTCDDYVEQTVAANFGMSKSTLSRFAGSRWHNRLDEAVPDLWRNTAQTLACHSTFVMAAKRTGVWKRMVQVLDAGANRGRTRDE